MHTPVQSAGSEFQILNSFIINMLKKSAKTQNPTRRGKMRENPIFGWVKFRCNHSPVRKDRCSRIGDFAFNDLRKRGEFVGGGWKGAENMADLYIPGDERIGDQGAVAAPGHGLGAHQRRLLLASFRRANREAASKLRGLHVVRVSAEAEIAPAAIEESFRGWRRPPKSPAVQVADARPRGAPAGRRG